MNDKCPNCYATLQEQFTYCPNCSQKVHLHRINISYLTHEAIHFITHADKGIFYLLKMLATNPGRAAREYIHGRRKKIFSPLNFFLIVVAVVVVLLTTFQQPVTNMRTTQMRESAMKSPNSESRKQVLAIADRADRSQLITTRYSNLLAMLATPIAAFFFWVFYRRQSFNYMEHLVANMYFVAFSVLVYAVIFNPLRLLTGENAGFILLAGYFLFEILYRAFAYYHFIAAKGFKAKLKAFGASLFVVLFWFASSYSLIVQYIRTGWGGLLN